MVEFVMVVRDTAVQNAEELENDIERDGCVLGLAEGEDKFHIHTRAYRCDKSHENVSLF